MTEEKKLSKNELKKMAKKAEKAAKKQGLKAQQAPAPSAAEATQAAKSPAVATKPNGGPRLALANAVANDPATLKVIWAAQRFNVELQSATKEESKRASQSFFGSKHSAVLVTSNAVIGGGGNSMAQAIAGVAKSSLKNKNQTSPGSNAAVLVDEWCEWERTVLRENPAKGLAFLEEKLSGLHLVPPGDSVADLCVAVTLHQKACQDQDLSAFPSVQRFLNAHQKGYEAALQAVEELVKQQSPLNMEELMKEPRLLVVVGKLFKHVCDELFPDIALPTNISKECQNGKDGDYQCTAAMAAFGQLKKQGSSYSSPKEVAQAIVDAVGPDHPILFQLESDARGFVLCRLRPEFLAKHVNAWLLSGKAPPCQVPENPPTCVVDFSSPNIAKEMHVGHLRSTIIGESVCRILESVGCKVHRVNHVGDWGTQFGMLIQYLKEEYPSVTADSAELPNITDLTEFYKCAKQRFDESPEFKKTAQTNVVKLQSGDKECLAIWKMLCDVSRREFEKVYKRLDVTVTECGESFYNKKIPPVIEEFNKVGKVSIEEGGAKCVFLPNFKIPLMLQKSDGGFGYDSTDMAALKYRLQELKADRIIIITDFSQGDHFKMVYAAGEGMGWLGKGQRLDHIGFGTVMGEDGKRFKTRSGETVRLVDLLDEAVNRMETSLRGRIAEGKANISEAEVHKVSEAIGYGAVKYYDLRRNPTSNYKFSYDQMLATNGDTAVYLLYARVRLESICAKAKAEFNVNVEDLLKTEKVCLEHPSERNLALHLQKYADSMEQALDKLYPYYVCEYVYKLANAASEFVTKCKVLGGPEMNNRLLLCRATTIAMKQCFDLLGIRDVQRI